jgi:hypothetical protein
MDEFVCRLVLALAVGVAVARSEARALLELRRSGAAAGAVGALVQLEPQVGISGVSWHQSTLDTTRAVNAGIHGLVLLHAQPQIEKHLLERLVVDAIATATHALVHLDIFVKGVLDDAVVLVITVLDLLVLVDVGVEYVLDGDLQMISTQKRMSSRQNLTMNSSHT